jgi:phosphatidylinositol alpha-1,6-mannosyltransferase
MKLLLLTRRFPPHEGAVSTWSFELARRLAPRCDDFAVCAIGPVTAELGEFGFDLLRLPSISRRTTGIAAWGLPSLRGRQFDAVLGSDWLSASLALAWRGRSSIERVFAAVHGSELAWRRAGVPLGRMYRRTAELALERFDAVFAANGIARAALDTIHVQRRGFIGRACDPDRFRPLARGALARQLGVFDRRVLLSVGRLVPERRIDKLLYAVSALGVRYPDLCHVIAGDGPERQRLELLAERLRIAHKVRFLGRVDGRRLPELYNLCDVFVHLSGGAREAADSDGSVLIEALSSAKPALITARWAKLEGIDEQLASIVPEDDSIALGDGLAAFLDQPERASRLGQRARAWVLANATWDRVADRLVSAMSGALRGPHIERDGGASAPLRGAAFAER